jgi:tetratricopeptide (TPR) repeat protein
MKKSAPCESPRWLEQAFPQLHWLLAALKNEERALPWLEANSHGVAVLTRALLGDKQARVALEREPTDDLGDLFELIDNEDLLRWLETREPDVWLLLLAVNRDEEAATLLKSRRPSYAQLVPILHRSHERLLACPIHGEDPLQTSALADMGCLVGEMHLRQGEYEKAIEAFTRAIETRPAADLFEARARAYQAMAEQDQSAAVLMRGRVMS